MLFVEFYCICIVVNRACYFEFVCIYDSFDMLYIFEVFYDNYIFVCNVVFMCRGEEHSPGAMVLPLWKFC